MEYRIYKIVHRKTIIQKQKEKELERAHEVALELKELRQEMLGAGFRISRQKIDEMELARAWARHFFFKQNLGL